MTTTLTITAFGKLDEYSNLSAYLARGEGRPAYKRALDAQLAVFTASEIRTASNE